MEGRGSLIQIFGMSRLMFLGPKRCIRPRFPGAGNKFKKELYMNPQSRIDQDPSLPDGDVSHADLLQRVCAALGVPAFGPRRVVLIDGTKVAVRTTTRHEEPTYGSYTRRWYTHQDRVLSDDLEDFADELGVLADHERLAPAPVCSRCRSLEVEIDPWYGCYARQCERCTSWSRATRKDRNRCADCRRPFTAVCDGKGSRCGRCYTARRD